MCAIAPAAKGGARAADGAGRRGRRPDPFRALRQARLRDFRAGDANRTRPRTSVARRRALRDRAFRSASFSARARPRPLPPLPGSRGSCARARAPRAPRRGPPVDPRSRGEEDERRARSDLRRAADRDRQSRDQLLGPKFLDAVASPPPPGERERERKKEKPRDPSSPPRPCRRARCPPQWARSPRRPGWRTSSAPRSRTDSFSMAWTTTLRSRGARIWQVRKARREGGEGGEELRPRRLAARRSIDARVPRSLPRGRDPRFFSHALPIARPPTRPRVRRPPVSPAPLQPSFRTSG